MQCLFMLIRHFYYADRVLLLLLFLLSFFCSLTVICLYACFLVLMMFCESCVLSVVELMPRFLFVLF